MKQNLKSTAIVLLLFLLGISPVYFNYVFNDNIKAVLFVVFLLSFYIISIYEPIDAAIVFILFSFLIKFNFVVYSYIRVNHVLFLVLVLSQIIFKIKRLDIVRKAKIVIKDKYFFLNVILVLIMFVSSTLNSINKWDSYRIIIVFAFAIAVYLFLAIYYLSIDFEKRKFITDKLFIKSSLVFSILGITLLILLKFFNVWDQYFNVIPTGSFIRLHFSEDPNYYASFILPGILISISKFKSLNKFEKAIIPICILAFILTVSFGTFIALGFGILLIFRYKFINFTSIKKYFNKKYMLRFGIPIILLFLLISPFVYKKFSAVIEQKRISSNERMEVWRDSLTMNTKNIKTLLLGVGNDNAKYNTGFYKRTNYPRDMHNSYLQLYAENGILGFAVFTLLVIVAFKKISQNINYDYSYKVVLYSILAAYFFIGLFNVYVVWFTINLIYATYLEEFKRNEVF
ncbi:O-antigen ligase family protein [Clostridium omnivorum]|uniref:O-antigen ligase-related domain-containing protein n=1 Tax=Clostridium omnivorum TaxID=1604902 RepID=A0ABQ5N0G0_9CLOT|nr:O-antigen ligase family protein [Clostridium sp. E14]GLC28677.1 hypothetical protein bsdE14_00870 [Clostridium sp. E14]